MHRLPTLFFASLMIVFGPTVSAATAAPQGAGGASFTCEPALGPAIPGEASFCVCHGVNDCTVMADSGVCKGVGKKKNDTVCVDTQGSCTCTLGGSRVSPGQARRPDAQTPATRNAPKVRDHRTGDREPAADEAKAPVRRDHRDEAPPPRN